MKNTLIKNICSKANKFITQAKPFALALSLVGVMLLGNVAFAADATDIFKIIVQFLGVFCLAGAALQGITGAIAYAEAKSDGEGPAMAKAENKLKSALLLGILGASLSLGASTLAGLISNSIKF